MLAGRAPSEASSRAQSFLTKTGYGNSEDEAYARRLQQVSPPKRPWELTMHASFYIYMGNQQCCSFNCKPCVKLSITEQHAPMCRIFNARLLLLKTAASTKGTPSLRLWLASQAIFKDNSGCCRALIASAPYPRRSQLPEALMGRLLLLRNMMPRKREGANLVAPTVRAGEAVHGRTSLSMEQRQLRSLLHCRDQTTVTMQRWRTGTATKAISPIPFSVSCRSNPQALISKP